ncbi:MAG: hypothetical protein AAF467_13905 [Actinomycetota bacterium]
MNDFWSDYANAAREAELFQLPAASAVAIVGPVADVEPTVARHRDQGGPDRPVFVYTTGPNMAGVEGWTRLRRANDLLVALDRFADRGPILVIDAKDVEPDEVDGLIHELRRRGVELVHLVVDQPDPSPEDLATWLGLVGQPSVVDLVFPLAPGRVVDLIDRGEPIASVAGVPISGPLLFALRTAE